MREMMRTKRTFTSASVIAASALAMLIGGCSSTPEGTESSEARYSDTEARTYSYLTEADLQNFHNQLVAYADAMSAESDSANSVNSVEGMRQRLSAQAINYEAAFRSGVFDEESVSHRQVSAAMLGFTGNPEFAFLLSEMARDQSEQIRVRVGATIGLFELGAAINQSNKREAVMFALRELILPNERNSSMRLNCVTAYARAYSPEMGDALTPLLNALSEDPDEIVRRQVLYELKEIGDPATVSIVAAEAMDGAEPQTRATAALALGGIKHPKSMEALLMIAEDDNAEVRMQAIYSLAQIADSTNQDAVIDVLINALYDVDVDVRRAAASAAAKLEDPRLVTPLASATSDRNDKVREAAINAMSVVVKKDSEKVAYVLVNALDDPDVDVSNASYRALKEITNTNISRSSEAWRDWFYKQYPDLNPETQYKNSPRPPWSGTGIGSSTRRSSSGTTSRNTGRNFNRNRRRR